MIRELIEKDRAQTEALLSKAPEYNLYVLGNLRSVGFDQPDLSQFWGDFDEVGQLRGVINRYMTGWVVYGELDADWNGLGRILDGANPPAQRLQDNPGGIESLLPFIPHYQVSRISIQTFMALYQPDFVSASNRPDIQVRRATIEDIPALVEFYSDAEHMTRSPKGVAQPVRRTRLWLAEMDGEVCSAALTNAETDQVAMIGGVYTPPRYRSNGYSHSVCSALCADLLQDGKRPVLYWETPAAGKVYTKLGFQRIGDWRALRIEPVSTPATPKEPELEHKSS